MLQLISARAHQHYFGNNFKRQSLPTRRTGFVVENEDDFGYFESDIQLDNNVISRPFVLIKGVFNIKNENTIRCEGIRVQLDATVILKFETTGGDHKRFGTTQGLLQGSSEIDDENYILSPVREELILSPGETSNEADEGVDRFMSEILIEPGSHIYPFALKMPEEPLPSHFSSLYGDLRYKVGVYIKKVRGGHVKICQRLLAFNGYNNLTQLANNNNQSIVSEERVAQNSVTLSLPKKGFLQCEEIPFQLIPDCNTLVKSISVKLVQRITYTARLTSRSTDAVLDTFEKEMERSSKNQEIFTGKLTVPMNCVPSYNVKPVLSVIHLIQYCVIMDSTAAVDDNVGVINGQMEVVIGTTSDTVEVLRSLSEFENSQLTTIQAENQLTSMEQRERSDSISSRSSESSVITITSVPPAYSELSSRAVSMMSLESLPPHYDDLG